MWYFLKKNNLEQLRNDYDATLIKLIENGTVENIFEKYEMGDLLEIMLEEIE